MLTKDIFNLFVAVAYVYQMENNISSKSISARSEQNALLLYPNILIFCQTSKGGGVKLKIKSKHIAIGFFTE